VLIVSAGVSVGEYDLVPAALAEAGVEAHLHGVAVKPGRPLLFGSRTGHLVFGLPGNPVSTLVSMLLFVAPALRRTAGHAKPLPRTLPVVLDSAAKHKPGRRDYAPCRLRYHEGIWHAEPIESHGSADVAAMTRADGLLVIPHDTAELAPGASAEVIPIDT
jgi:molybdopterin molybdotransferase